MPETKEKTYYKAVRRASTAVNSGKTLKQKLDIITRAISRSMSAGASIVLLDSTKSKLICTSSSGLPQYYVRKGILEADKSLTEVLNGVNVVVSAGDSRLQYPEMATKAGIVSIIGIPVKLDESVTGSIRVYAKIATSFTNQDISFLITMANMASLALISVRSISGKDQDMVIASPELHRNNTVKFAHPSEIEFAQILDFYNIEWVYEPHSFPLQKDGDRITLMFTPDFYLPGLDLYVEVTTMKQSLVTAKNRKVRLLKKLYPHIKIILLHKNEYDRLLARYGCGPLAYTKSQGIKQVLFPAAEIDRKVKEIAAKISHDYANLHPIMIGIQRGFICFMADMIRQITIPVDVDILTISYYGGQDNTTVKISKDTDLNIKERHVILVEGVVDTGITLNYIIDHLSSRNPASMEVCALLNKKGRRIADVPIKYSGFDVAGEFVVGYGLDYYEEYRNLPYIGVPELENPAINYKDKKNPK